MTGNERFEWNLGGWLGGQIGGSAWIMVAGLLTFSRDAQTAASVLGVFALANILGYAIWTCRHKLTAHAGMQLLLVIMGVAGLAAVYLLDRDRHFEAIQSGGSVSAAEMYLVIIFVIIGLMLMFYVRFGRDRSD